MSGAEANNSGRTLEDFVENEARIRRVRIITHGDSKDTYDIFSPILLIKHYPYTSIYGADCRSEFLIRARQRDVRLECKYQQTSGSVDEKFPYLLENAKSRMPESEILILIAGDGARKCAKDWLRKEAAKVDYKYIRVIEISEYRKWFKEFCELYT